MFSDLHATGNGGPVGTLPKDPVCRLWLRSWRTDWSSARNPAPYGFLISLGGGEHLVGASPEIFVRVSTTGLVETCPISGTIQRGKDAVGDSINVRQRMDRCSADVTRRFASS